MENEANNINNDDLFDLSELDDIEMGVNHCAEYDGLIKGKINEIFRVDEELGDLNIDDRFFEQRRAALEAKKFKLLAELAVLKEEQRNQSEAPHQPDDKLPDDSLKPNNSVELVCDENAKFEQNGTRRKIDIPAVMGRLRCRQEVMKSSPAGTAPRLTEKQEKRKIRTAEEVIKTAETSEQIWLAKLSAKGDLKSTIVLIQNTINPTPTSLPTKPLSLTSLASYSTRDTTATTLINHLPKDCKKLPPWRWLSVYATAAYYQLGAAMIGANHNLIPVPFNYNLSQQLWSMAQESGADDVSYLQHRFKTALDRALGRPVDFWFSYEVAVKAEELLKASPYTTGFKLDNLENITGKPHLHGTLLIAPNEAKRARKVFHDLNGSVSPEFKKRAVYFRNGERKNITAEHGELYVNLNWAEYCTKENLRVRRYFLINQKAITATHGITKAAKAYYEQVAIAAKLR